MIGGGLTGTLMAFVAAVLTDLLASTFATLAVALYAAGGWVFARLRRAARP